ncbi:MAG: hypothetical protein AAFV53_25605 [Myxococcota bacterium]
MTLRLTLSLVALSLLTLSSCDASETSSDGTSSDDGNGDTPDSGERSYSGPGSYWTADFDERNGTFQIEVAESVGADPSMVVAGTYEDINGWKVLTVVEASDVEGAPAPGVQALGVEVPGFAFLLRPMDEAHNSVIPMLIAGECPEGNETLNWMIAQGFASKDASDTAFDFFGTYRYDYDANSAEVPTRYALHEYALQAEAAPPLYPGACDGSVIQIETAYTIEADLPPVNLWMVPGGAMVETWYRHWETGVLEKQTLFGMPAAPIALDDVTDRTFIGMHFSAGTMEQPGDVMEITVTFDGDGVARAAILNDVTTGETAAAGAVLTVDEMNTPSAGFFTGGISADGASLTGNLACAVAAGLGDDGQSMMTCVGQNPGDNREAFTMMLVEQR